jgi:hypothetical protein
MKFGCARYLELVERRLELLRAIVRLEAEWRGAFIGLKMEDSERLAAEQKILCEQIRTLDKEIVTLQGNQFKPAASIPKGHDLGSTKPFALDPILYPRILGALERMAAVHLELKRSNQTRQAILKRSKLTMNALRNLFNSYAPTYAAPAASTKGTICQENV